MKPSLRRLCGKFLVVALVFNSLIGFSPMLTTTQAQQRVIVVNAEQPNIWTLEQAHYLLAQMHRRNLDLKAKSLQDLDPNEIAGLRFDVMRMLVEFGATFNQADLVSNRLLSDNQNFNAERRQQLLTERDSLRRESLRLTGDIEELETEKANTDDEDAKKRLDARIAAKNTRLTRVDKEIEQLNGELGTLTAPSGQLTSTTGGATFEPGKLPQSALDEAFKAAAAQQIQRFNQEPKLNASLRLDNFLQMQYEIISKQLSLLRDELGPGERLIFLELPQTVNVAHHEADRKWAQSWWKIAGYTRRERSAALPALSPSPSPPVRLNQQPITTSQDFNSIIEGKGIKLPVTTPNCTTASPPPFTNSAAVRISDGPATAKSNPSSIRVSAPGKVTKVTVTLKGFRHSLPEDVDIMLVGPQGQNAIIMSDVGGTIPVGDLDITLDDAAPNPLPVGTQLHANTYRPMNDNTVAGDLDKFPASAPAPLGGDALSVFNGTDPNGEWKLFLVDDSGDITGSLSGGWSLNVTTDCGMPLEVTYNDVFVNLDEFANETDGLPPTSVLHGKLTRAKFENRIVRTVELIPRQSSLNVNDMNLRVKSGAFNFVLSTLFGFGSRLNIQRQREQFSQFVQQELYSSAFGKGAREFGWTFTPMPGTDRLQSGVRNTYAAIVVPDEASAIVLESNGCYFPRSEYQPINFEDTKDSARWGDSRSSRGCGTVSKAFVVPIPTANINGTNDFWVEGISFQPVEKGKTIVVLISGKNFSPQIGVLINSIPLVHSIGLAQPLIRDDSAAGRLTRDEFRNAEITGSIERIDPNKIVFSFKPPPDFQGTPTITLVAPGKAIDINWLNNIDINGTGSGVALKDFTPKMFGQEQPAAAFRIDKLTVFRSRTGGRLTALINGAGFRNLNVAAAPSLIGQILVNGTPLPTPLPTPESAALLRFEFDTPADEKIKVTLISANPEPKEVKTIESSAITNPAFLSVSDVEVTTYEASAENEPATLLVKIKGTGFTDALKASVEGKILPIAVKSATEAVFTIPDPKAAAIVTLEDDTGQKAKLVITRKTAPPK